MLKWFLMGFYEVLWDAAGCYRVLPSLRTGFNWVRLGTHRLPVKIRSEWRPERIGQGPQQRLVIDFLRTEEIDSFFFSCRRPAWLLAASVRIRKKVVTEREGKKKKNKKQAFDSGR